MPDHTHLNLLDQFIPLIDTKLHAQNQLYNFFSSWDIKVLIASLDMPGQPSPHLCKITPSVSSFNWYVPVCKKLTLYLL